MKTGELFTLIWLTTVAYHKAFAQDCSERNEKVFNGYCYSFNLNTSSVLAKEAISACKGQNATLADIRSQEEQTFISDIVGELVTGSEKMWIDGQAEFTNWHWANDGSPLGVQGCFKLNSETQLMQAHPDSVSPTECAKECLKKWSISTLQVNFIYLKAVSSVLFCYCVSDLKGQDGYYSESCTTPCDDGNYTCGARGAIDIHAINGTYSNWIDAGRGNEAVHATPCAMMDGSEDYRWVRVPCYEQHAYICEYDSQSCPSKGETVAEKCITISGTNETWFRARYDCIQNGGDLVTVATEQAQTELMTYFTGLNLTFWIGATSFEWKLTNGDTMIFTDWEQGQPRPPGKSVHTQLFKKEGSHDLKWQLQFNRAFLAKYICKRAAQGSGPLTTPTLPFPNSSPGSTSTVIPQDTTDGDDPSGLQQDEIPVVKIVVVVVIILVLSVVLAICIILIKKRRQRPDLYSDTDKLSVTGDIEDYTNPMNHANSYDNATTTTTPIAVPPTETFKPAKAAKIDGVEYNKENEKVRTLYRTASGRPVNRTSAGDTIGSESSGLPSFDEEYIDPKEMSQRTNPSTKSRESRSSFTNPCYQGWGEADDEHYETPNEPIMTKVFDFTGSMKSKDPSGDGETPGLAPTKDGSGTSDNTRDARKLDSVRDRPAQPLPGDDPTGDSVYELEGDSLTKSHATNDKAMKETNDENIYEDPDDNNDPDAYSYTYMQFQPKK
ncbi:uncharacterized protein LOC135497624 [Lineus longissimus]|uniref:uncharacterized protein LOC135497624 n=1 Tax=Lineus longissimus TaxID=88925 RepID=UPI002B4F44AC